MKQVVGFLGLALVCFLMFALVPGRGQGAKEKFKKKANKVQNSYIVVLDDSVVGEKGPFSIAPYVASELASKHNGKIKHVYQNALNGFSVEMSEAEALALSDDYRVKF